MTMFRRIAPLFIALASIACGPEGIIVDDPESPTLDDILAPDGEPEPSDEGGDEAAGGWGGEDPAEPEPLTAELVLPDMPEDEFAQAGWCCSCASLNSPLWECVPIDAPPIGLGDACAVGWAACEDINGAPGECADALCQ